MNISCRWKWPLLRYMIMDKDHKMQDLMQRSKWLRYFAATCSKGGEISPPLTCAYRCQHMLTCMKTYRRHIHSIMKTAWQQALEVESMLRSGGGGGAAVLPLSVVELMDREHRHMKHKDSEKMLSGVTLLQVYSTFTQQWKKRAKKKKVEVEDEMRILQQSLENERWGRGNRRRGMSLSGKSCPQDIRDRVDSYEYCMIWNTGN